MSFANRLAALAGLSLSVACALSFAAERPHGALPLAECLDPGRARAWHMIDMDEILVDAGRKRFHLQLLHACPELTNSNEIVFSAGNGIGRICGSIGESVVPSRPNMLRVPCNIAAVNPLTKAQFDAISAGADAREVLQAESGSIQR